MADSESKPSIDPLRLEVLCESLRKGCTRRQAIAAAGLSKTTFYRRLKEDGDLKHLVEDAEVFSIAAVENALWKTATGGNVTAQIFYLINRAPDAWKDRQTLAIEAGAAIPDDGPDPRAVREALNRLTDEAKKALQDKDRHEVAAAYPAALVKLQEREGGNWGSENEQAGIDDE